MPTFEIIAVNLKGRWKHRLQELAEGRGAWFREVRKPQTCLRLLEQGSAGVVLIRLGADLYHELELLGQISRQYPRAAVVVVSEVDYPHLAGLAWDLGAKYVWFPPQQVETLLEIVTRMMPT